MSRKIFSFLAIFFSASVPSVHVANEVVYTVRYWNNKALNLLGLPQGLDVTTEAISDRIYQIEQEECVRLERRLYDVIPVSSIKIHHQESGVSVRLHFKQLEDLEEFIHRVSSSAQH